MGMDQDSWKQMQFPEMRRMWGPRNRDGTTNGASRELPARKARSRQLLCMRNGKG